MEAIEKFTILSLDGGGSKGVYTLGVLHELEKKLGGNLYEHFNLIYGTSTGSIIGSMLGLGENVATVKQRYFDLIPKIMGRWSKSGRSRALRENANSIFGQRKFDDFKTSIGIVATNYDKQRPLIFKNNPQLAHGRISTFQPGFGCTISQAIQASSAAYPIFDKIKLHIEGQGDTTIIDGGFIANNPTLFAITDAFAAFKQTPSTINVISIGVGKYTEKPVSLKLNLLSRFKIVQLVNKVLATSTITNEQLASLLFTETNLVRVNDVFLDEKYKTNMVEKNKNKLNALYNLGRESFGKSEKNIERLFSK
jgi:uncharacterized protein